MNEENIIPLLNEEELFKIQVLKQIRENAPELTYEDAEVIFYENFPEFVENPNQKKLIKKLFKNQRVLEGKLNQLIKNLIHEPTTSK